MGGGADRNGAEYPRKRARGALLGARAALLALWGHHRRAVPALRLLDAPLPRQPRRPQPRARHLRRPHLLLEYVERTVLLRVELCVEVLLLERTTELAVKKR